MEKEMVNGCNIFFSTFIEETTGYSQAQSLLQPRFRWEQIDTENGLAAVRVHWLPNFDGIGSAGSHFYVQYKYVFL